MAQELEFFKTFVELFNVNAAFVIFFLCAHIILRMYQLDRGVLKARLFLNETVLHQVWTSISIAGTAFTLNVFLKLVGLNLSIKNYIQEYYLIEMTQFIFVMAFVYAIINWNQFLAMPGREDFSQDKT
jgi:hypothetical protein